MLTQWYKLVSGPTLWDLFLSILGLFPLILVSFPLRIWGTKSLEQNFSTFVSQFFCVPFENNKIDFVLHILSSQGYFVV